MRKALIVGINDYEFGPLCACIPDANRIANILSRDYDNTPNFHCKKLTSDEVEIDKELLKDSIIELFTCNVDCDVALFYFSGHGSEPSKNSKACLVTQDAKRHTEGIELDFLLEQANQSKAREKIIILDCCFSGDLGNISFLQNYALLNEGISILTSSHGTQVSYENAEGGIFTSILISALEGGAADTIGQVTVASMYSYADKLLGPWDQRPIFKSFVSKMISLRKCKPLVSLEILRKLPEYFVTEDFEYPLDPTYEPEAEPKGHDNEKLFADLQKYNRASLVIPNSEEHMFFAAVNSKSCSLTPLGKYYWKLAKEGKL